MELNQEEFSAVVGVKINDGGIYDIPSGMTNNLFVASDFKTLSKVRLPMGGIPVTSGGGTSGEFLFVSNMGDQSVKPVLEVIQNRQKKVFSGIGEDISVDTVAIQWGETILFYYPDSGAKEIYFIRFPSPSEIGGLPKNPTFNTVTVTDHIAAKQLDLDNWLLMYTKKAGQNPGIRLAQNFLSGVGATATKSLDRESCYLEIGGAEYGVESYRLIGMGYQKEQKDLQPLMFGFQETSQSGNTVGDFVVFLRESGENKAPVEKLRITSSGRVILPFGYHAQAPNDVACQSDINNILTGYVNGTSLYRPVFEFPAFEDVKSMNAPVNCVMSILSSWSVTLDPFSPDQHTARSSSTTYDFIVGNFVAPNGQDWLLEIKVNDIDVGKSKLVTPFGSFKSIQIKKPSHVKIFYGTNDWVVSITEMVDAATVVGTA